ncbi:hypothetical protein K438DRAFT_1886645 [Mycena galopus ATCC 62051]|nr:hypothetical protein K438DRAFT_1886645 [Mycena galopus ATCC 62051]
MVLAWISSWGIWRLMGTRSTATRMARWTMMPTPTRASTPTSATSAMCGSRTTVPAAARVRFPSTSNSNSTGEWGWGWRATAAARSRWPLRLGTSGCRALRLRPKATHCRQRATPLPTRPARRNATVARTTRATPRRIRPRARRARRAARARWCCLRLHVTLTLAGCRTSGAPAPPPPARPPASMNTTGRISTGCITRMGTAMCITGTAARPRRRDTRLRRRRMRMRRGRARGR